MLQIVFFTASVMGKRRTFTIDLVEREPLPAPPENGHVYEGYYLQNSKTGECVPDCCFNGCEAVQVREVGYQLNA